MIKFKAMVGCFVVLLFAASCAGMDLSKLISSDGSPDTDSTVVPGTYTAQLPSASGPERKITLELRLDGYARFTEDYQEGLPFIQEGVWTFSGNRITTSFRAGIMDWDKRNTALILHNPGEAEYGSEGIRLQKVSGPAITNIEWQWVQTQTPKGIFSVEKPENHTLILDDYGGLNALLGCNRAGGKVELDFFEESKPDRGTISIEQLFSTLMFCEDQDVADRFSLELQHAVGFFLRDGLLFVDLFADSGTMMFRFLPSTQRK